MHYKRWKRMGRIEKPTAEERFFSRLTQVGDCWMWHRLDKNGYGGPFFVDGKPWLPHRWSYSFLRADIPEGLELDHMCRNRGCVNPWHLEPVTRSENAKRTFREAEHHASLIGV